VNGIDTSVDGEDEFQRELERILAEADAEGVDVEGAWDVWTDEDRGYTVEISVVER
jgi:hypothetical protein